VVIVTVWTSFETLGMAEIADADHAPAACLGATVKWP